MKFLKLSGIDFPMKWFSTYFLQLSTSSTVKIFIFFVVSWELAFNFKHLNLSRPATREETDTLSGDKSSFVSLAVKGNCAKM